MTIWHCICLMWSADVTLQKCHPSADLGVTPQTEQVEILSTLLCLWAVEQMLCQVCPYKRSPRQHLKQIFIFKLRYLFLTIKIEISDIHCSAITYSCNKMSGVNSRRLLSKLWYEKFAQSCPPTLLTHNSAGAEISGKENQSSLDNNLSCKAFIKNQNTLMLN